VSVPRDIQGARWQRKRKRKRVCGTGVTPLDEALAPANSAANEWAPSPSSSVRAANAPTKSSPVRIPRAVKAAKPPRQITKGDEEG